MLIPSPTMTTSEFKAMLELLSLQLLNWRTGALAVGLLLAALMDLRTHHIPNRVVGWGAVCGVVLNWVFPPFLLASWLWPLQGLMMGLLMFLPFYMLGVMGAGDVKLMAMVGAFLGPVDVMWAVLYTLLAGGALSLVFVLVHGTALQLVRNLSALFQWGFISLVHASRPKDYLPVGVSAGKLPYALAIALGTGTCLVAKALGFQ